MPNAAGIPNCDEDYAKADAGEIVRQAEIIERQRDTIKELRAEIVAQQRIFAVQADLIKRLRERVAELETLPRP